MSQQASSVRRRGALPIYLARREKALGRRIPSGDPIRDAQVIAEALGPRGVRYVEQMLAELSGAWPVDDRGERFDFDAAVGS